MLSRRNLHSSPLVSCPNFLAVQTVIPSAWATRSARREPYPWRPLSDPSRRFSKFVISDNPLFGRSRLPCVRAGCRASARSRKRVSGIRLPSLTRDPCPAANKPHGEGGGFRRRLTKSTKLSARSTSRPRHPTPADPPRRGSRASRKPAATISATIPFR